MSRSRDVPAVLILLAVAGLAAENFSHYPIAILCTAGIVRYWRDPGSLLGRAGARTLIALFACIWIPMLLSLPDAVNPARAVKTTTLYLHYLPAGLYILASLHEARSRRLVLWGTAAIVAFWCLDGLVQLFIGRDFFGYPYDGGVLKGMFYPKQRFGLVLAVLAPIYLYAVQRLSTRSRFAWLLLLPFVIVLAYSVKRTAWLMFGAAIAIYLAGFFVPTRRNLRAAALVGVIALIGSYAAITYAPRLNHAVNHSLNVFSSDFALADQALSYRLSLWRTGFAMVEENWINGVGPRGYRSAYRAYAGPDDFWIGRGSKGQTHPHLMSLEVATETGVIGVLGYAVALCLLTRSLWRARRRDPGGAVFLMAALVAWFPLNAHLAFYGSYWSNIAWIAIALGLAGRVVDTAVARPASARSSVA